MTLNGALISGCGGGAHPAVSVKGGGQLTMTKCELDAPCGAGVQLADGASASLHATTISRPAKAAVAARKPAALLMDDCTVADSAGVGVMLFECGPAVVLRECKIHGSTKAAIQVSEPLGEPLLAETGGKAQSQAPGASVVGPLLERCSIRSSGGAGVYVLDGAAPVLKDNKIHGSGGPGVRVEAARPHLEGNVVSGGSAEGMRVSGRARDQPMAASGVANSVWSSPECMGSTAPGEGETDEDGLLVEEVVFGPAPPPAGAGPSGNGECSIDEAKVLRAAACAAHKNLHRLPARAAAAAAAFGPESSPCSWPDPVWEEGEEEKAAAAAAAVTADAIAIETEARAGALLIRNTVEDNALAGILVTDGASALLEANRLSCGRGPALVFSDGARGLARGNELWGHAAPVQLEISGQGTAPHVERNTVRDASEAGGALCHRGAAGLLAGNIFFGHGRANVRVSSGATTRIIANEIRNGGDAGLVISSGAAPLVARNDVSANRKAGVLVFGEATRPLLVGNRIHHGEQSGLYFYAQASGELRRNDIFANRGPGVLVTEASDPLLVENLIREGEDAGVLVHEAGKGTLIANNVHSNRTYGVAALKDGAPTVRANWLHGLRQGGILVDEGGKGEYLHNDIESNAKSGVTLRGGCFPILRSNLIRNGHDSGVHAMLGGGGLIEDNDIFENAQVSGFSDLERLLLLCAHKPTLWPTTA